MAAKIPLVLIPGLLCDATLWAEQVRDLADIAEVIVPDTTRHDTVKALAHAFLDAAPRQFALAGLSMGGYVSLEIMRQAPERVLKLALLDTTARADTPEQKERRRLLIAMSKKGEFRGVTPRLLPLLIHPDRMEDKPLTTAIMSMAERVGREAFHNQQTAIMNRPDGRADLRHIACPTLVIGGRQDVITPPEIVHEMAEGIKDANFTIIENSGHLTPMEKPDEVSLLMRRWLVH